MEEYFHDFVKQGFYVPELLCTIDETTLESMGISKLPMGKQIKFFKELEQLKQKLGKYFSCLFVPSPPPSFSFVSLLKNLMVRYFNLFVLQRIQRKDTVDPKS
jgi:hypothetical protein